MKYTHIAFDIDGTLTNSEFAVIQSLRDTLTSLNGFSPPAQALSFALGIPGEETLKRLQISDIPTVLALWIKNLHKYMDTITLFPGIETLLAALKKRGIVMGVVTSQTPEEYEEDFARCPIAPYFSILVRAGETPRPKPSPDPLLHFLKLADCRPADVLYVGDREGDLRCARDAGVDFALAGWGNPDRQMEVNYCLEKPEELLTFL